jgi:hypothetical protein
MPLRQSFDPFEYGEQLLEAQVNPLDPVDWAKKKAGIELWSKQQEIIRSIRDNRRTAVQSGHGIGKSLTASVAASWWVDTHPADQTLVVTTAPSVKQVHAILWEEIRKIHSGASLPGEVQISDNWLIGGRLVGFGRKPQDHDRDAFQGLHRKYLLVIIDEAAGIPEWLWGSARDIATGEHCRMLAIGNPTDPSSYFRRVCRPDSGWNVIKVSVFDSPNFTGEKVAKTVSEDLTSHKYIEDAKRDLGEGSPMWKARVEGEFPDVDEFSVIPLGWIYQAQQRWQEWDDANRPISPDWRRIVGADIARFGNDKTCFAERIGDAFLTPKIMPRADTMATAAMLSAEINSDRGDIAVVDTNGVGAGVYDAIKKSNQFAMGVNVGNRTSLVDTSGQVAFYNLRAAVYWKMREALDPARSPTIMLPPDDDLASDLSTPHWKTVPGGKIVIESKDEIRKRLNRSPDKGDAVCLAWWASGIGFSMDPADSAFDWNDGSVDGDAIDWDASSASNMFGDLVEVPTGEWYGD